MASSDSQIDKPQHGRPKRAELPNVNINTGVQSVDTERASLSNNCILGVEDLRYVFLVLEFKDYCAKLFTLGCTVYIHNEVYKWFDNELYQLKVDVGVLNTVKIY